MDAPYKEIEGKIKICSSYKINNPPRRLRGQKGKFIEITSAFTKIYNASRETLNKGVPQNEKI